MSLLSSSSICLSVLPPSPIPLCFFMLSSSEHLPPLGEPQQQPFVHPDVPSRGQEEGRGGGFNHRYAVDFIPGSQAIHIVYVGFAPLSFVVDLPLAFEGVFVRCL